MGRNDKDFRYMACSDLLSNLEKENFKLDAGQEKKISAQLLKLIVTDTNGEVQTLAQNWYVALCILYTVYTYFSISYFQILKIMYPTLINQQIN